MLNLAEYRNKPQRLADFLPWAALIAPGIVLNKDGSFQRTARFRGPDLESATPAELVGTTARLNNALRRLGSGWAIFVEASRVPAQNYPRSRFPDPVSALVDHERRAQFEEEGAHFESFYTLTLVWMPPVEDASRAEGWLYEGKSRDGADSKELLKGFADRTDRILQLIDGFVPEVTWLGDESTLTYLHACVSTKRQRVRVPETRSPRCRAHPLAEARARGREQSHLQGGLGAEPRPVLLAAQSTDGALSMGGTGIIDQFLETFTTYIDSGFGLLGAPSTRSMPHRAR
jgi:type IV secretory pathway VirB4 component